MGNSKGILDEMPFHKFKNITELQHTIGIEKVAGGNILGSEQENYAKLITEVATPLIRKCF